MHLDAFYILHDPLFPKKMKHITPTASPAFPLPFCQAFSKTKPRATNRLRARVCSRDNRFASSNPSWDNPTSPGLFLSHKHRGQWHDASCIGASANGYAGNGLDKHLTVMNIGRVIMALVAYAC